MSPPDDGIGPAPVPGGTRLSICITTRNRAELLRQTLASILPQATEQVEIVVVDGASTDHTGDVAREGRRECPRLRYVRKERNSGVDRDYNASVEAALGEYCWFMSDDDLLKPGAVRTVLEETSGGCSLLVLNAEDWNHDFSERIKEKRLPFGRNRFYAPSERERFFIDTAHHLSFIPALVIRRDLWMSRERERYFGSWFAHVGVVFQRPLPGDAILVAEPLIRIRNENISWGSRIFEIWAIRWPALIWSLDGLGDSAKGTVCPEAPSKNWRTLLAYRAMGAYSRKEFREFILPGNPGAWYRMLSALISVVPPPFINAASSAWRKLVGP
ncbi:MAG: glycosyl transferase [Deltaproteobacteria bacterium]|nr:glycosyl transferase [Deltaproteobacteria bacterium]